MDEHARNSDNFLAIIRIYLVVSIVYPCVLSPDSTSELVFDRTDQVTSDSWVCNDVLISQKRTQGKTMTPFQTNLLRKRS